MNYNEAMEYITAVGNFGSSYGLERIYKLLEKLGNPQEKIKVIHIAGTNGKGSTTSMISKILIEHGYKVGMYTSPFLEEFEERIQINNENINKFVLAELVTEVKEAVNKVIEEGYKNPTEFEIITAIMFLYFYREEVDFAVVEVGLGGRLDATNVINPILSVITSISFDHTNLLGNTLEEIASEKAGIIKENTPVIIYPQKEEVLTVIKEIAINKKSKLYIANLSNVTLIEIIKDNNPYQKVLIKSKKEYNLDLPLLGEHQILNLNLAINTLEVLEEMNYININSEIVKKAIKEVKWKGRLEVLNNKPLTVIDGAHNIQGITQLRKNIEKYFNYKKIHLILGILADKDVKAMIEEIVPIAEEVYAVTPNSCRAELGEDLKREVLEYNKKCHSYISYKEAYEKALENANEDDLILASGSLYMIGDMRKIIRNYKK